VKRDLYLREQRPIKVDTSEYLPDYDLLGYSRRVRAPSKDAESRVVYIYIDVYIHIDVCVIYI